MTVKTVSKLFSLLLIIVSLVFFFKDAQAHDWIAVSIWAGLVCVNAKEYSQLYWKNVSITTIIDGKTYVEWYLTNRGARRAFDKSAAEILDDCRARGIPVHDHRTEKK